MTINSQENFKSTVAPFLPGFSWRHAVSLFSILLVYASVWYHLAAPYRFFPSDDRFYFQPRFHHLPFFQVSLKAVYDIFRRQDPDYLALSSAWPVHTLIFSCLILLLVALILYHLSRQMSVAVAGMLLYATSSWHAVYYFWGFYAVTATAMALSSLGAFLWAVSRPMNRYWGLVLSGVFSGLFFLSSPSAPVYIFCLGLLVVALFWDRRVWLMMKAAAAYAAPVVIIIGLAMLARQQYFFAHWQENLASDHRADALRMFGYGAKAPFFSFFRLMMVYQPVLTIGWVVVAVFFLYRYRRELARHRIQVGLLLFIIGHGLVLDLLPFTKLGRAHYVMMPVALISYVVIIWQLIRDAALKVIIRRAIAVLAVVVLSMTIFFNARWCARMYEAKQQTADRIQEIVGDSPLYMMEQDPFGYFIGWWLGVDLRIIKTLEEIDRSQGRYAILFGPHGPGSGLTVLNHCTLPDFEADRLLSSLPADMRQWRFPYYAHLPPFFMEEEISQAFYLEGKIPDWRLNRMQLTLWMKE